MSRAEPTPDGQVDRQLESTIRDLLSKRAATASICPSDAARVLSAAGGT